MTANDLPFPNLRISDSSFLDEITERHKCSKCEKSKMYYCYNCFLPLDYLKDRIPQVKLPIQVDVIKHPGEVCGKSTAVHAAILAPEDVRIHIYPDIPDYDPQKTLLLYPCDESRSLKDYVNGDVSTDGSTGNDGSVERVIFIDSTWFQAFKIFSDPKLKGIPRVEIDSHDTKFWRYQLDKPTTYLSTIEAIYYCIKEYDDVIKNRPSNLQISNSSDHGDEIKTSDNYDDLLFFFSFFYRKIRRTAIKEGRTLKSYTNQRRGKKKINQ